jgi:hypothetical protein
MRWIVAFIVILTYQKTYSQELFVITDPASNVPANIILPKSRPKLVVS